MRVGVTAAWLHRLLGVLGLFALLQTPASVVAFPEIAGWQPNHGHISANAFSLEHSHPYDHQNEHAAATSLLDTEAPPTESSELAIVFTPSRDGTTGASSVTSSAILSPRLLVGAAAGIESLAAHVETIAPPDAHVPVATPPPRT